MMTFNVDSLDCQWMDKTIIEYKKYMNLYSEDEWNSYGFGITWKWVFLGELSL